MITFFHPTTNMMSLAVTGKERNTWERLAMWEAKAEEDRAGMCMEEGRKWWVQVDVQREVKS